MTSRISRNSERALSVRKLNVAVREGGLLTRVVEDLDFDLHSGEVLALVGESGCGKTKTAEAIMGLLPPELGTVRAERIQLGGTNLAAAGEPELRRIRGSELTMVFQDPLTALDPVFTIGHQLSSLFRRHRGQSRAPANESSRQMLERVGFPDIPRLMRSYPHQLSGGMRQRVMIAMSMACHPRVLIADEPTTALDVTTQAQVLAQLTSLGREVGTAILLITHDLGVVAQYCDRALVMRRGRIVEEATVDELFDRPEHPYSRQLLAAAAGMSV